MSMTNITEDAPFSIRHNDEKETAANNKKTKKRKKTSQTPGEICKRPHTTARTPRSLVMRPGNSSLTDILSRPCESAVKAKAEVEGRILAKETSICIRSEYALCCSARLPAADSPRLQPTCNMLSCVCPKDRTRRWRFRQLAVTLFRYLIYLHIVMVSLLTTSVLVFTHPLPKLEQPL